MYKKLHNITLRTIHMSLKSHIAIQYTGHSYINIILYNISIKGASYSL